MYMRLHKLTWGGVALGVLLGFGLMHHFGWNPLVAAVGHSVEFNLARLSPEGEAVGYAVPASGSSVPSITATCNADGSATFTWYAAGASSYNYYLDNKTRGGWEFASQPCSASPINGDYCGENVLTTSFTVGAGSVTAQEYSFSFKYNVEYTESWGGAEGGGSVIRSFLNLLGSEGGSQAALLNTYNGGSKTITCGDAPPPTCSIAVSDCTITTAGGMCDAAATWSASNVIDNQVKVALVWPNGYEDLWSRYGWPPFGFAPANFNGAIAGFHTPGTYTAKVYDKSNRLCATDTFDINGVCSVTGTTTITDFTQIKNRCDAQYGGTLPAGTTYPSSLTCAPPTAPLCSLDCPCTPVADPGLPNLQAVPQNFRVVKGVSLVSSSTFEVGESITFIGSVWNVGTADVVVPPQYYNRFQYRLVGDTTWTTFANNLGKTLVVGGANNELGTTTFSVAGTYEVRQCADATNIVTESSEADNCTPDSSRVIVTIEPSSGTGVIQGYRVNQSMVPGFANVQITAGSKVSVTLATTGSPYQITGLGAGTYTVTSAEPVGRLVQYCLQSGSQDCTSASHYTMGNSLSVTLANGETKGVWWRYLPFEIDFKVALVGTDPATGSWTTNLVISDPNREVKLKWDAPDADRCEPVGSNFVTSDQKSGNTGDTAGGVLNEPAVGAIPMTYQIKCFKGSYFETRSVTVSDAASLPPTVDLRARAGLIRSGNVAELWWTVTNAASCTLTGGGLNYSVPGTDFVRASTNPYVTPAITSTQVFTLTCENSIGLTGSDSVRVEVTGQAQER